MEVTLKNFLNKSLNHKNSSNNGVSIKNINFSLSQFQIKQLTFSNTYFCFFTLSREFMVIWLLNLYSNICPTISRDLALNK